MRSGILATNSRYRDPLSNDLGATAGLLFDLGSGRYAAPRTADDEAARGAWEAGPDPRRRRGGSQAAGGYPGGGPDTHGDPGVAS